MKKRVWRRIFQAIAILLIACVAAGLGLVASVYAKSRVRREIAPADCAIVLGARVWVTGEPSDALQYRLDSALAAFEEGLCERFIVCGARGDNEPLAEAEVMKRVLVAGGVPEENVFMDAASYNTEQNIANAKAIMEEQGFRSAIVITSDYHVERAMWLARDAGISEAYGLAAASPRPFFTIWRLRLRESASWVVYLLRKI